MKLSKQALGFIIVLSLTFSAVLLTSSSSRNVQQECNGCYYKNIFYSMNSLLCMSNGSSSSNMYRCVKYSDTGDYGWKYYRAGCN